MTAAAAKYKRQGESKTIAADKTDAAVAAHMPDEVEITKSNQETNQVAATECAEGESSAAIAARRTCSSGSRTRKKRWVQRVPMKQVKQQ